MQSKTGGSPSDEGQCHLQDTTFWGVLQSEYSNSLRQNGSQWNCDTFNKGLPNISRASKLEPHHWMQFSVIPRAPFWEGILSPCRRCSPCVINLTDRGKTGLRLEITNSNCMYINGSRIIIPMYQCRILCKQRRRLFFRRRSVLSVWTENLPSVLTLSNLNLWKCFGKKKKTFIVDFFFFFLGECLFRKISHLLLEDSD